MHMKTKYKIILNIIIKKIYKIMINESQSDSESTTQLAKAPNLIEKVHGSSSGIIFMIQIMIPKFKYHHNLIF